jgi:hypothetical protein
MIRTATKARAEREREAAEIFAAKVETYKRNTERREKRNT